MLKSLSLRRLPVPLRAFCAPESLEGAVISVLAAKTMSPGALAVKRGANGVRTAGVSRVSSCSTWREGARRRRRGPAAGGFVALVLKTREKLRPLRKVQVMGILWG